MERKTKVVENGAQGLIITRQFELPVELLFKAYTDAEIVQQWMNTKVLNLENRKYGSWKFETLMPDGTVAFQAGGVYHEFVPNEKITRTFEMNNAMFDVQLEFLEFKAVAENKSMLEMQIVYRSPELRDQMLKLPFAGGLNMAHDKLEELMQH